jgi:hypothetical protein
MKRRVICMWSVCLVALMALPSAAQAQRERGQGGRAFGNALRNVAGVPSVTEEVLLPSMINSAYASLDADNPLEAAGITYAVTGLPTYDQFFLDVANVRGALTLAAHVLQLTDDVLEGDLLQEVFTGTLFTDTLGTAVDVPMDSRRAVVVGLVTGNFNRVRLRGLGDLTDGQLTAVRDGLLERYSTVVDLSRMLPAAVESLAGLPTTVTSLVSAAPGLVTNAPAAFAGPQAINAPRVVQNIGVSVAELGLLPNDVAQVTRSLRALTQGDAEGSSD